MAARGGLQVAVVGAGIIGLACALELRDAGHEVRVFDPTPGRGASYAAAGMLAPAGEAWFGDLPLFRLGQASVALWPAYAAALGRRSGVDVDLRRHGSVLVGLDRDDLLDVGRRLEVLHGYGVVVEELDGRGLRRHEPALARVAGGALLPEDHQVDPRRVVTALLALLGDAVVRVPVAEVEDDAVLLEDGSRSACDAVVLAAGAGARRWVPQVRGVRGETIRLRVADGPRGVVRGAVHGQPVYLVPRAGGELVVGATEEEHAASDVPVLGPVLRLLTAARTLLPGLERAELLEVTSRARPGSPDNAPLLGPRPGGPPRHVLAVGHHRGGVLLAPLTARTVRAHLEGTPVPQVALPFRPDRTADRAVPAHPQESR